MLAKWTKKKNQLTFLKSLFYVGLILSVILSQRWLLIGRRCFLGQQAAKPFDTWQAAWTNLFSNGRGDSTGFTAVWLLFQHRGITINQPLLLGLMTEHGKSQQQGHFLNSAGLALIGSGTAILTAYLIASWEKSAVKCESKHVDCRKFSSIPDEKASFYGIMNSHTSSVWFFHTAAFRLCVYV